MTANDEEEEKKLFQRKLRANQIGFAQNIIFQNRKFTECKKKKKNVLVIGV